MPLPIGGARRRAVLAALLLRRGAGLSVERLVDMLWPAAPPATAATMVHAAVSGLRKVLEPDRHVCGFQVLATRVGGYRLDVAPEQVDAVRFEQLLAAGRALMDESPRRASGLLAEALAQWRAPALVGVEEPFARAEAARLDELRLQCVELHADVELRLGGHQAVAAEVEELVSAHPLREGLCARLMVALYRCGRRADALAAYRTARRTLVAELGVEPGPDLRRLQLLILRDGEELRVPAVAQTVRGRTSVRLPAPLSSFVGRHREQDDVSSVLCGHRLVTLTGTGGVGKTRLALEVARRVADRDNTEAVMVDLTSVTLPELVEQALADALRVRAEPGQPLMRTIAAALSARPTLVVFDNCEHVLGACADAVQSMLAASAEVRVLATGRECLAVPGERVYPVRPLRTPAPDESPERVAACEAVMLFADRAAAAHPGFTVTSQNASLVGELCRRLDGLPLAVELASARIGVLPLGELVARLGDRFRLLESVTRAADRRHRGLAAMLAWSYELLEPADRALFARLAVFPAGFDLPAVTAVCAGEDLPADVLGLVLARLVACSLLQLDDEPVGDARYRLLETVREYARQQLDPPACAALEERHAAHFLAVARQAQPRLFGAGSGFWLEKLHIERDNLRAALEWGFGRGGDGRTGVLLAGCLWHYWDVFGAREEGLRWLHAALTMVDAERADQRMPLLSAAALLHLGRAEFAATTRLATEQLSLSRAEGNRIWEGDALAMLATIDWAQGWFDRAQQRYEDGIAASLVGGDRWRAAMAEAQLARLHRDRYEPDAARQVALRSRVHAEEVGEGLARGLALDVLASLEHRWGDDHTARKLVADALEQY
ncbi:MAG: winged helix-turn-helix domain-containing protein, partial [Pseudonocardia sp.]|nr:winged helix-turn-helix domain-containing protein [Pseudonocardia sp.]